MIAGGGSGIVTIFEEFLTDMLEVVIIHGDATV